MRAETLVCDRCRRPVPRLIEMNDSEVCGPCMVAAVNDALRTGLVGIQLRMDSEPVHTARVLRVRR